MDSSQRGTCLPLENSRAGTAGDKLTWQWAAQDLHPQADAPIIEPGLWIYTNVAGHHGDWQLI